jgi:hypothetical protein
MEVAADKRVIKELADTSKALEAKTKTSSKTNITRIKASDKKRRKK